MAALMILLALCLPVGAGFWLARKRPAMPAFTAALLASLPLMAVFGLLVASFVSSGNSAPFGVAAALVFGTMALLCGFGLGMVGHKMGQRGDNTPGGPDIFQ
ncbi:hypothetical protein [Altererythrobacter lauratis]|uniref:Uncharacterized protein n=1 Tax=Alteraurantiacibacter lauratis TaxID=2054627 RepID=A0ABV7EEH3_9SPHN